jgi:nucleoside-diphosphate-sugar epimerase
MPPHPFWKMRPVLVTGGSGFGGSHLIRHLLDAGATVTSFDLALPDTVRSSGRHHFEQGDIRYQNNFQRLLDEYHINTVFHLAAQAIVPQSLRDPAETWSINLDGTLSVLEAMRRSRHTRRMVFASSGAVYGSISCDDPIGENHPPGPIPHAYAASKIAAEAAVESHSRNYGLHSVRCRFMNTYGPGDRHTSRLIPGAIDRLLHDRPYDFGDRDDGTTELDFLHIDDMCRAYLAAGEKLESTDLENQAINFGSANSIAISEVTCKVSEAFDGTARTPIFHGEKRGIPLRKSLDIRRAKQLLNWQPQISLDHGIIQTLEHSSYSAQMLPA